MGGPLTLARSSAGGTITSTGAVSSPMVPATPASPAVASGDPEPDDLTVPDGLACRVIRCSACGVTGCSACAVTGCSTSAVTGCSSRAVTGCSACGPTGGSARDTGCTSPGDQADPGR